MMDQDMICELENLRRELVSLGGEIQDLRNNWRYADEIDALAVMDRFMMLEIRVENVLRKVEV